LPAIAGGERDLSQPEPRISPDIRRRRSREEVAIRLAGDVRPHPGGPGETDEGVRAVVAGRVVAKEPLRYALRLEKVVPVQRGDGQPIEDRRRCRVLRESVDEIGPALPERIPVPALDRHEDEAVPG